MAREAALEELAQVKREMEEDVTSGIDQLKDFGQPLDPPPAPAIEQPQEAELAEDPAELDQPSSIDPVSDQPLDNPSREEE
jgi:hypothetical protein